MLYAFESYVIVLTFQKIHGSKQLGLSTALTNNGFKVFGFQIAPTNHRGLIAIKTIKALHAELFDTVDGEIINKYAAYLKGVIVFVHLIKEKNGSRLMILNASTTAEGPKGQHIINRWLVLANRFKEAVIAFIT